MVKIVPTSHCHQKIDSQQRSCSHHGVIIPCSHFATPIMVLYRKWANDLGAEWPNWKINFAKRLCEVIARKGLNFIDWISNWKSPKFNILNLIQWHKFNLYQAELFRSLIMERWLHYISIPVLYLKSWKEMLLQNSMVLCFQVSSLCNLKCCLFSKLQPNDVVLPTLTLFKFFCLP